MNVPSAIRAAVVFACLSLPAFGLAAPPVAGPNVNMVSGTKFPEGDPSLTKQNEESHAVSSRNPRHLMGGANDYRQVPILAAEGARGGKAWIQIYKSVDGGESWRSTPLGGCPVNHPQCDDPTGLTAAVKALKPDFSADPTMRPGPFGTFFLSFIAGKRDTASDGMIAVQRFVDKNNDIQRTTDLRSCTTGADCVTVNVYTPQGCTPNTLGCTTSVAKVRYRPAQDPFLPDKVNILDRGTPGQFNDKPWNAADVPGRPWNGTRNCELLSWTRNRAGVANVTETVPEFNVYVSFAKFVGQDPLNEHPQMHIAVSNDCGNTFGKPVKLTTGALGQNSGSNIAIDPLTGAVYVVWRNFDGESQIFLSKSTDGGKTWSKKPIEIAKFNPYDQGTTGASFRTLAFPTIAVSVVGATSRVHVAWSQRKAMPAASPPYACQANDPADCDARVVMKTSTDGGNTWPALPTPVDSNFTVQYETNGQVLSHQRGHQVQPAMAFAAGKLLITWLDQRLDHTEGVLRCPAGNTCTSVNQLEEFREGVGNLDAACSNPALPSPYGPACNNPAVVFRTYMSDGEPGLVRRHTLDTFAAMASPAAVPVFSSTRVSQYTFGSTVAGILQPDGSLQPSPGIFPIRQKEVNAVNLPMFADGRAAFIGDYIEAAGQHILGSKFNVGGVPTGNFTTSGPAPVFHVAWTDNRDVIPPIDGNWATPTCLSTKFTTDSTGTVNGSTNFSGCVTDGFAGNRNANVYSAVVAENSQAFAHSNSKSLNTTAPRSFTVTVQNLSDKPRTYTLCLTASPGACSAFTQTSGVTAAFNQQMTSSSPLTVIVQPRSSSTRSVWARVNGATLTKSKVLVGIESSDAHGTFSSQVVLNPDPIAMHSFVTNGDGDTFDDVANNDLGNVVLSNAVLTNNALSNNALTNNGLPNNVLTNNALTNAVLSNVMLSNAVLTNFQLENLSANNDPLGTNALTNAALSNVVLTNAVLSNNVLSNAVLSNAVLTNTVLNAALTNLDPGNVALSNAVLTNNALTNVVLSNSTLGNAMLSNAVLSNAALTNVALSNAALSTNVVTNNALSNNVLSNNVLTNAPLADLVGNEYQKKVSVNLRAIEPGSFELTSSPFETSDLQNSNFRETSFTVRNRGNTDATLSIRVMVRDAICTGAPPYPYCTTPPGYKLQLILRKVAFTPSAIAPTVRATDQGQALRIGLTQRNAIVSNIGTLQIIDPEDPDLGKFLPDDPASATLALGAGEFAYATIRAIGVGGATPPDPADLLRWGVKTVSANSTTASGPLLITTLNFPPFVATDVPPDPPSSATLRTFGGVSTPTGTAVCTDKDGAPVLSGTSNPAPATGAPGDFYINTTNQTVFGPKDAQTGWGADTPRIVPILNGTGAPEGVVNAAPGSYYIDINSKLIYGPKAPSLIANTGWGSPAPEFVPIVSGTGAPEGVRPAGPGTYYIDTAAQLIYGPKTGTGTNTGWGSPTTLGLPTEFLARFPCPPTGISIGAFSTNATTQVSTASITFTPKFWGDFYTLVSVADSSSSQPKDRQVIKVHVNPRPPVVTFPGLPADITYKETYNLGNVVSSTSPVTRTFAASLSATNACFVDADGYTLQVDRSQTFAAGNPSICVFTVSQAGNETYAPITVQSPARVVKQAEQIIDFGALATRTYGDADITVSATSLSPTAPSTSSNPITFSSSTTGACLTDGTNGATVSIRNAAALPPAGTGCAVSANQAEAANYLAATPVTRTFAIDPKPASVAPAASSKTYGSPDPAFSGTLTGFVATDSVNAVYTRTPGETVAGSPYIISATLSAAPSRPLSNYTITYSTANFTINPKPASVTPDAKSKTFGDSDPLLTGTLDGFVAADNVTAIYSRQPGETVAGSPYTISATLAPPGVLSNYDITYNTADFNINKAPVQFTLDPLYFTSLGSPTSIEGKLNRPAKPTVFPPDAPTIALLPATGTLTSGVPGGTDGTFTATGSPASENYVVTFSYAGDANFLAAPTATSTLRVEGFSTAGSMATARARHTTTLLNDGRVLIAGGFINGTGVATASVEVYCPDTMAPSTPASQCQYGVGAFGSLPGPMTSASEGHTATLLPSGKVLVVAGGNTDVQLFDPSLQTWTPVPVVLLQPLRFHTATLLPSGKVFIAGGADLTGNTKISTYIFDSAGPTLASGPDLTVARESHTATLLGNGKVLIAGGHASADGSTYNVHSSADLYDPSAGPTGSITGAAPMAGIRFGHEAALQSSGEVLVAGGSAVFDATIGTLLTSAEIYDPDTDSWSSVAAADELNDARRSFTMTPLNDGWPLAAGGFGNPTTPNTQRTSSELFDPGINPPGPPKFEVGATMATGRAWHRATLLPDGRVLVTGGVTGGASPVPTTSAELYNGPPQ